LLNKLYEVFVCAHAAGSCWEQSVVRE